MSVAIVTLAVALAAAIGGLLMLVIDYRRSQTDLRHADYDRMDELRVRLDAERRCDVETARSVKAEAELAAAVVRLRIAQAAINTATAQEVDHARVAATADHAVLDRLLSAALPSAARPDAAGPDHRPAGPDPVPAAGPAAAGDAALPGRR